MSELTAPECLACGVCCFSEQPRYVPVSGDDYERLDADAERLTHFLGNKCFLRLEEGHCAALRLEPASGLFVCTIYERRPQPCRDLERGSPQCAGERHEKSERPVDGLRRLRVRVD